MPVRTEITARKLWLRSLEGSSCCVGLCRGQGLGFANAQRVVYEEQGCITVEEDTVEVDRWFDVGIQRKDCAVLFPHAGVPRGRVVGECWGVVFGKAGQWNEGV